MASTIWKGALKIGKLQFPIRFYSAVDDRSVHFHLLHEKDESRVRQAMTNPTTGDEVPRERIQRGVEVEDGTFVVVHEHELQQLEPRESRAIEIEQFVPTEQINRQWYDRPYVLGPDEKPAAYFALVKALSEEKVQGLARWVMRKRAYIGSLQASRGYLMMITLRSADEVVSLGELPRPAGRSLEKKEIELAQKLVEGLHGRLEPERYQDEYRQRLLDFINAKANGQRPKLRLVRAPKITREDNLTRVLTASLKSLRKGA